MIFYIGTHMVNHARYFERAFISVNILRRRVSDFAVNNWILDSGAFTELSRLGKYEHSVEQYAQEISRWSKCGNLEMAVTQDYMCEPFMLEKTGMTIHQHQELTISRYDKLVSLTNTLIMPVLQGYHPEEYVAHLKLYGSRLTYGMRVGVGSVCKRNSNPQEIVAILESLKDIRPDLQLHGFGLKTTALANLYILSLLHSADSLAWSYRARRNGGNANGLHEALDFVNEIGRIQGSKPHQFTLVRREYGQVQHCGSHNPDTQRRGNDKGYGKRCHTA